MRINTTRRTAIAASTVIAASLLQGSPASAYYEGFFCSEQSSRRANYTWGDGTIRTKVYYNNHCRRRVKVTLNFITIPGNVVSKCWRTPAGKGSKVWNFQDLNDIQRGCG
ncbi:hypothetical protein LJR220_001044 [Bradyrhizobium sp. LjRoot220]|uniref:hypothetical protein n=1 Tax=Bradyrhizobium sp. LjRoot220 TaxID=3342284 RepID=UPI003ECCA7D4